MTFWQKALSLVSGKKEPIKHGESVNKIKKKPFSKKSKKKIVKTPKKLKKILKIHKKTVKKVKKITKKKAVLQKAKAFSKKKIVKKHAKKKQAKKIPLKPRVALIEEKLPKKRALALLEEPEVVEFITATAGEEGYKMYKHLVNVGTDIDEYTLADKAQLQINYARSLLYKLYDHKLVSFFRERDKKKGWFIYYWKAHPEKLKYILIRKKEEKIEKLDKEMLKQHDSFFCQNCNKNFEYTEAIENMFFCNSCGNQLAAINITEVKKKIQQEIEKLRSEIAEIKKI
ncbi:MAG: hypothetical protein PHC66_02270 [Candidatus Nanoarchaeia archaeon]|nr:hypothetical protein [Candidatus Nanoarchaeia archaeon]MDD5239520.1 hypothetical protein [Candidatus Nanoarchaeia archaeon]